MLIPTNFRSEAKEREWWDRHADALRADSSHLAMRIICATMGMDTMGADFDLAQEEAARAISEYIRWSHHEVAPSCEMGSLHKAA